jgi:hypothetical protein
LLVQPAIELAFEEGRRHRGFGPKLSRLHGGWRERDKPGQTDILSAGGNDNKAGA